ncbi:hypothetical protein [Pedobacter caeni]|uniref:Lipoprotein n=1 Tax=Pedobacter caeni TaxID=288992 RepID=A0A1M5JM30_9SPHI|nr:hypothetical protein [Pedobacter caeni]SHG41571.1 hypothetical protein SAMN04488522_105421 [Pedobacter caeni]
MKKTTKINLGCNSILNNSLYGLMFSLAIACTPSTPPKSAEELKSSEVPKTVNDHLIAYIDSAASRITRANFNDQHFHALTDSFTRYFPISVYKPGQKVTDSTVFVTMDKSNDPLQDDVITVTLPRPLGMELSFKALTEHFGPLDPDPPLFRQHENPPPVSLSLKKHFNPAAKGVSLSISAAHFYEEAQNQIVSVKIVKSKIK